MPGSSHDRPQLLWLDLTRQARSAQTIQGFREHFDVQLADGIQSIGQSPAAPDMLCVEFDHPDSRGLHQMQDLLHHHPSLPLTMLSVQHSEELAVWAFRAGVWEFLVLPLSDDDFIHYVRSVQQLMRLRRHNGPLEHLRLPVPRNQRLPACINEVSRQLLPLYEVQQHLDRHFRERIEEADMARLCCMSPAHFSRMFKQEFNIGFQDYLTCRRMEAAMRMLQESSAPVSTVAYSMGYRDPSYFARAFRRHFGISPSACRTGQAE